jgi:hypothetical protein
MAILLTSPSVAMYGIPGMPTFFVKALIGYSLTRNAYHIHNLPEKDCSGEHILMVDKVTTYPFACMATMCVFPFQMANDLRRIEYSIRGMGIPHILEIKSCNDVIFK